MNASMTEYLIGARYDVDGTNWAEMWTDLARGKRVEWTEQLADYFLDLLPPRWMNRRVGLCDGLVVLAEYGFGEGDDRTTVVWRERGRWFAQLAI